MSERLEPGTYSTSWVRDTFPDEVAAIEAEARRPALDVEDRWRLVRVGTALLPLFGTRTDSGQALTATWGEPDENGIYEPVFTASGSTEDERLADARRLDFVTQARHVREEHDATHGEAEMCGAECIVMGLAEFEYAALDAAQEEGS